MAEPKFNNFIPPTVPDVSKRIERGINNIDLNLAQTALQISKSKLLSVALKSKRIAGDSPEGTSYIGTPFFGSLTFGNLADNRDNGYIDIFGRRQIYTPMRFIECLFDIQMSKNIVSTQPQGLNGAIKQYINNGDYQISVKGKISGRWNSSENRWEDIGKKIPYESIRYFNDICKIGYHIKVSNQILNNIGINYVVITDHNITPIEGHLKDIDFSINMVSDNNFTLEVDESNLNDLTFLSDLLNV